MGVDAEFLVRTHVPLDDAAFEAVRDAFRERFPDEYATDRARFPDLKRWPSSDPREVAVVMLHRFLGLHYARSWHGWPFIRDVGDWLLVRFGETAEVRYGSDMNSCWDEFDPWPKIRPLLEAEYAKHPEEHPT